MCNTGEFHSRTNPVGLNDVIDVITPAESKFSELHVFYTGRGTFVIPTVMEIPSDVKCSRHSECNGGTTALVVMTSCHTNINLQIA